MQRKKNHNAIIKLWHIERDFKQKERIAAQKLKKAQVQKLKNANNKAQ